MVAMALGIVCCMRSAVFKKGRSRWEGWFWGRRFGPSMLNFMLLTIELKGRVLWAIILWEFTRFQTKRKEWNAVLLSQLK